MLAPPTPGQQAVGIEKNHIDPHRGGDPAEHQGHGHDSVAVRRDLEAEEAAQKIAPIRDSRFQHHGTEAEHDAPDHIFQDALVEPQETRRAAIEIGKQQGQGQDEGSGGQGGKRPTGHVRHVDEYRGGEGVLRKLPNQGRRQGAQCPTPGEEGACVLPHGGPGPLTGGEGLVRDGGKHDQAQDHAERGDPEKRVAENGTGEERRRGGASAQGHRALEVTRAQ